MADIANLVLGIDSTQVPKGTAALNELTAAGARAEAATTGLGMGFKGAGAQAAAMASAAQLSARAAMDQAAGFGAATKAAQVNTMALRESLVVTRELMRGNFTRLPGSLMLLGQGVASQGGIGSFVSAIQQQLGLVKTLQNAELAEQAVAAASAAAAVQGAAERAAANVMAADTEIALAEAQVRVAAGTSAEAAAQERLTAAHASVAAAASEAAVAENALGAALARSGEASAASAAETVTTVSGLGAALGITAIAAGLAAAAFTEVKDSAEAIDPSAKQFIDTLGLTKAEINRLKDTTVTWGDVVKGTFDAVAEASGSSSSQFVSFWHEAFLETAQVGVSAAQTIMGAFAAMVKGVHSAISDIGQIGTQLASGWHGGGAVSTSNLSNPAADALAQFNKTFADVGKFFHQTAPNAINRRRDNRLQDQANKLIDRRIPKKPKKPKKGPKAPADHAFDMSARLDDQILAAKLKLAGSAEEQAGLQLQQIAIEKNKTIVDAQQLLKEHKLTTGEEQHIELQAKQLADLKAQAVIREEQTKLLTQQQAAQDQLFGFQLDSLKFADQMAMTANEHRKAQLEMLDIETKQKAVDLQILEQKQLLNKQYADAALTQGRIAHLPLEQAQQKALINRNNMDPLKAWANSVPHTADMVTEAIQGIETHGFDMLAQGIAGVVTGTESLGKAFKDVAHSIISDIIQMTVKMLIFRAISGVFGGAGGGIGGATDFSSSFGAISGAPHFANGGSMIIGGNPGVDKNVLSLNGKPVAMVGRGETLSVFPNRAANNNQSGPIEIKIGFGEAPAFAPYVQDVAGAAAGQAVKISVEHTNNTLKAISRQRLNGAG